MANGGGSSHPHLRLEREQPVTERRPRQGFPSIEAPTDPAGHWTFLGARLRTARDTAATDLGGYDQRRLIKITLTQKVSPEDIARASSNIDVVSQEEGTLVLAFAAEAQLEEFEAKLVQLAAGEDVTYMNLLYALQDLGNWTPEDRTGWALSRDGFPTDESFAIDAELWPLARGSELTRLREAFETWVDDHDGEVLDAVRQPYLTIYRIRCSQALATDLLRHRDVRAVDLPPRIGLERAHVFAGIQELDEIPPPPDEAPGIVVLDSGLATGHPVLAPAVGDAQGFLPGAAAADEHGHGTSVSGIALYDDVADCLRNRSFVPELRLFSGRLLNEFNEGKPEFIENQVERAVRYFVEHYGCRVFNLSYGDANRPYRARHVAGLAVTLDVLSRELDVLFVVPTGNFEGDQEGPADWRGEYPRYLIGEAATLLDPAPALNALTVGSLARHERNERWPDDPAYLPVARANQPSPFTRHGPSVNAAIKPDLVDFGGNMMVDARTGGRPTAGQLGVGELSVSREFATGRPFAEDSGTSFAAPRVANAAARILGELPNASVDLCRALLVAHARTPPACADLFAEDNRVLLHVTGYGLVDRSALFRSLENCVTLWAEESIGNRRHHFFEIPLPDEFWSGGKRDRKLTVALAFRPPVRTTRIDYRAAGMSFKLVQADSIGEVAEWFNAAVDRDAVEAIPERIGGRRLSETVRSKGSVQASTWIFVQPSRAVRKSSWFVVVTRNDPPWGVNLSSDREPYALAVTLDDRAAQQTLIQSRLYTQIATRLTERIRLRGRS